MRYLDFIAASLLVAVIAFIRIPGIDNTHGASPRRLSYAAAAITIERIPDDIGFDLILLGDSRSMMIDAPTLCEALSPPRISCLNAATTAGDWVSAHDLARRLEPHLMPNALFVVAVSDYWFESGPDSALEILPRTTSYWAVGEPASALASWIPLASERGGRMRWLHEGLQNAGERLTAWLTPWDASINRAMTSRGYHKARQANVDDWYSPTDEATRRRHLRAGRNTLSALLATGAEVVLVNLPNPEMRERYVDRTYPGRRERFRAAATKLAAQTGVPFVDLAGSMPDRSDYRDFHHVKRENEPMLRQRLADALSSRAAAARISP